MYSLTSSLNIPIVSLYLSSILTCARIRVLNLMAVHIIAILLRSLLDCVLGFARSRVEADCSIPQINMYRYRMGDRWAIRVDSHLQSCAAYQMSSVHSRTSVTMSLCACKFPIMPRLSHLPGTDRVLSPATLQFKRTRHGTITQPWA